MIRMVWDFGGGEVFDGRAERARRSWKATVDALPVGARISGVVVNRQRFGVFINIDGHPDAMGLVEAIHFPGVVELPPPGTPIVGEVLWLNERNHQVKIRFVPDAAVPKRGTATGDAGPSASGLNEAPWPRAEPDQV